MIFESSSYILLEIGVSSLKSSSLSICSRLEWPKNTRIILSGLACCVNKAFLLCAAELCVWSCQFLYMWPKNWLFEVLPLKNLPMV